MLIRSKTSIGDITIDATLRISHRVVAEVTQQPIEEGADIADHMRLMPQGLEIVGIIVPDDPSILASGGTFGENAEATARNLFRVPGLASEARDVEAWQNLKALIRARKRLEIVTRYDTYFILPIELIADEDAGFGTALQFTMRFMEVEIGSVRSLDNIDDALKDTVGGKVGGDNLGQQTLGGEEEVQAGKQTKPKPKVVNSFNTVYQGA